MATTKTVLGNLVRVPYPKVLRLGYLQQTDHLPRPTSKKAMFAIRAAGSVAGNLEELFSGGLERAALQPEDIELCGDVT